MTRLLTAILGLGLAAAGSHAGDAEIMSTGERPLVTLMSQSLREMGLDMGQHQKPTKQDFFNVRVGSIKTFDHPQPSGEANVVFFAMVTKHPIGERLYDRSKSVAARDRLKCSEFPDADAAQQTFLDSGGPEIDRHGLDRDGDGYACAWDPVMYRRFLYDVLVRRDPSVIDIRFAGPGHFDD